MCCKFPLSPFGLICAISRRCPCHMCRRLASRTRNWPLSTSRALIARGLVEGLLAPGRKAAGRLRGRLLLQH
eukprot:8160539-Pyramimonas_sp.AAC.2